MFVFLKEKWWLALAIIFIAVFAILILGAGNLKSGIHKITVPIEEKSGISGTKENPKKEAPPANISNHPGNQRELKGVVKFKSYKGLAFAWGMDSKGHSTFRDWLSSKYDERTTSQAFDQINAMGVKTVSIWLWLDRMLVKDSNWGTDSYKTQFDPTYQANWESFLRMVKSKNMEVIVIMFPARNGTDHDPYSLEGDIFTGQERGAKWKNYIQAVKDWVSMYGSNTEYGPAIVSWQGIKEASDGGNYPVVHDFLVDFYQAIKSTGTTQPVGIDNSPYFRLPVTDPTNQRLFSDAADYYNLHLYRDDGVLPDVSKLNKPFIIGELGADTNICEDGSRPVKQNDIPRCPSGEVSHLNSDSWNPSAVQNFYQNGLKAGAKTALAWMWQNPTIMKRDLSGNTLTFTLGPAGEWIKSWNP